MYNTQSLKLCYLNVTDNNNTRKLNDSQTSIIFDHTIDITRHISVQLTVNKLFPFQVLKTSRQRRQDYHWNCSFMKINLLRLPVNSFLDKCKYYKSNPLG